MIIPVRCFSCGKVIGHLWSEYLKILEDPTKTEKMALDELNLDRYCCRRMLLGHVDLIEKLLCYNIYEKKNKEVEKMEIEDNDVLLPKLSYLCGSCGEDVRITVNDPVRCDSCGHRILYKARTNKVMQFQAR